MWLAEHHFSSFSVCPSVHMMGVMAAARTKRLRIGTAVSLAPFYNPLRLAEEVALLDVLSGGRVNWGAGRGFERSEFKAFGVPGEESVAALPRGGRHRPARRGPTTSSPTTASISHFDGVEVLPKPLQAPHPPVWMAATSMPAIDWAAAKGFSILMDPHCIPSRSHHQAPPLRREAQGRRPQRYQPHHPHGPPRRHRRNGGQGPRGRPACGAMDGRLLRRPATHHRQEARTFGGKDPIDYYLEDVVLHGTADSVADQIRALEADAGMTYLMAAPLSRRSFALLTDKVLPRVAG